MPLSLYLHLPYCRRKCPYCDFFKLVPKFGDTSRFSGILQKEMTLAAKQVEWTRGDSLATVYFGGGTPSLHSPREIAMLLETAHRLWGISPNAEITLEANPGTLVYNDFVELFAAGVNRLSIGAQSFTNRKISLLYRDHEIEDTQLCVEWARRAGFRNLSLDLIFGLPGETVDEWEGDIKSALELVPEHVSLYNLEYHPGTPIDRWRQSGKWQPLEQDLEAEMYLMTHNLLRDSGFEHYEVSNFAKSGFAAIHNAAYWQGKASLGLGPSAFSFDGIKNRHANVANIDTYFQQVDAGTLPINRHWTNSARDAQEEWISGSLRQSRGIDRNEAGATLGDKIASQLWRAAAGLPEAHRELSAQVFRLTAAGWFVENEILGFLFGHIFNDDRQGNGRDE